MARVVGGGCEMCPHNPRRNGSTGPGDQPKFRTPRDEFFFSEAKPDLAAVARRWAESSPGKYTVNGILKKASREGWRKDRRQFEERVWEETLGYFSKRVAELEVTDCLERIKEHRDIAQKLQQFFTACYREEQKEDGTTEVYFVNRDKRIRPTVGNILRAAVLGVKLEQQAMRTLDEVGKYYFIQYFCSVFLSAVYKNVDAQATVKNIRLDVNKWKEKAISKLKFIPER